ncbi:MAG TPA: tetratricopeptide repeat protein [Flavobacterium sp.]|uniref:tetratricopeptide repeat-containing sensor histidine kinase n=1 Tax=Flavobacterium sp. TaxID=239 RepID=UPI002C43486D|nr:tetratricopeptide repeat protein [Flavobacterium sp.]HPW98859.1 tetratricopeptide repeat protein [Flavobacterium sp.]HQA74694.1 tetratricopeptide repeat protein [Flavobacterium sp.]
MKIKHTLFIVLLAAMASFAQTSKLDSLMVLLPNTKNDIDKVQLYNAIAEEYKTSNPNLMLQYANKAEALAKKIDYKTAEGYALLHKGNANIILGNYKEALLLFSDAQHLFESLDAKSENKKGLAKALGSIGIVFSEQSNYSRALQYYLKSVKIYEALKDEVSLAKLYNNIGIVYHSQGNEFKSLEYFSKAQKTQERLRDKNIGITYTNIANSYLKQNNAPKALEYYQLAKKALDLNQNPRALGEWYNNMGLYYQAETNNPKAIESWQNAIQTFQTIDDKFGMADTYIYLAQLYLSQNELEKTKQFANQSLALATELEVLEQIMLSEKLLSDCYAKQNNATLALEHFKRYSQAKDSLTNEATIRKSVEEELNFEFDKREALQQKEIEKRDLLLKEESKRNTMQLIFAALFGLLLFGFIFLIYNRMQLKKNLTLQKELSEYEQKALHLQMNPHFVFNCLGSISSFIVQNGTDSAIKYLSKFSKLMRLTLEYSKESLIPIDKEIEGLQNYLELEQLRFNNMFSFTITKSNAIDDDVALPPLLLQPFIENAIIHGVIPKKEMGSIAIDFIIEKESLVCIIEDNGIGFEQSKIAKKDSVTAHKSMALDITKKRLELMETSTSMKANVEIIELKNDKNEIQGTKVILKIPVQYIK